MKQKPKLPPKNATESSKQKAHIDSLASQGRFIQDMIQNLENNMSSKMYPNPLVPSAKQQPRSGMLPGHPNRVAQSEGIAKVECAAQDNIQMTAPLFNVDGQGRQEDKKNQTMTSNHAKMNSTQRSNENLHLSNALSEVNIQQRVQSSHAHDIKPNAAPNYYAVQLPPKT